MDYKLKKWINTTFGIIFFGFLLLGISEAQFSWNQPYWGSSWNQPYWGSSWNQPYWGSGYNQPYWGSGYNQPYWGSSYNQPYFLLGGDSVNPTISQFIPYQNYFNPVSSTGFSSFIPGIGWWPPSLGYYDSSTSTFNWISGPVEW